MQSCSSLCNGRLQQLLLLGKSINTQTHKHKPLSLVMVLLVNNGLVVIRGWYCCGGEGISIDLTQGSSSCCTHIVEGKRKKDLRKTCSSSICGKCKFRFTDRAGAAKLWSWCLTAACYPPTDQPELPSRYNSVASHLVHWQYFFYLLK